MDGDVQYVYLKTYLAEIQSGGYYLEHFFTLYKISLLTHQQRTKNIASKYEVSKIFLITRPLHKYERSRLFMSINNNKRGQIVEKITTHLHWSAERPLPRCDNM